MSGSERRPLLTREALITGAMLALAAALAWGWLLTMDMGAQDMGDMPGMTMPMDGATTTWTPATAFATFLMWAIMMVAMMLPSAAPMMMLYAKIASGHAAGGAVAPTFVFVAGYVAVWAAFSLTATGAQWTLAASGFLTPALALGDTTLGGALIIAAGLYQLTALKRICLSNCRSPLAFLTLYWRPGVKGALGMGLRHGAFCVGCCWFVMALLFVGGIMNLLWVVAIAAFVLVEKVLPFGERVGQAAGAAALAVGTYLVAASALA